MEMFLSAADIEANSKETYARHLTLHVIPYIGKQRVAEVSSRETIHRLLTVALKERAPARRRFCTRARPCLRCCRWPGITGTERIKLKGVPAKPIVVATKDQFLRVYNALPHQPVKVLGRLGVSSDARLCELISFIPEDFGFATDMLAVRRSIVEVTAKYHPTGDRFLTREYTKNGEHRRFKVDHAVSEMVREHIALHGIGPGQVIFPVRSFASTEAAGRDRLTQEELDALGFTGELPNGRRYKHGTLGGYVTAKCRCRGCKQWSADYARDRKRRRTGRSARERSPARRNDPTEYLGADVWRRIWDTAVDDAGLPFPYTPYQVRHTHVVAHRPGCRPRPRTVPTRPRRPSGHHAVRQRRFLTRKTRRPRASYRRYSETLPRRVCCP